MSAITIHYDVHSDYIAVRTFVEAAYAFELATSAIGSGAFRSRELYEVVVLPAEEGSFRQRLKVILDVTGYALGGALLIVEILDSGFINDLSELLTDRRLSEEVISLVEDIRNSRVEEVTVEQLAELERLMVEVASQGAKGAMSAPRAELERALVDREELIQLEEAQSRFFGTLLEDQNILAVDFDDEDGIPIPRSQFAERAVPPRREREDEDFSPQSSIVDLVVTSPNFSRTDQRSRKWKGRILVGGRVILFEIYDADFWSKLEKGRVEFGRQTAMTVQMLTVKKQSGRERHVAVKVISINNSRFSEPYSNEELESVARQVDLREGDTAQARLFDLK